LFVGYQAYAEHERCAGLRQAAEDDNLTVPEWHAVMLAADKVCTDYAKEIEEFSEMLVKRGKVTQSECNAFAEKMKGE